MISLPTVLIQEVLKDLNWPTSARCVFWSQNGFIKFHLLVSCAALMCVVYNAYGTNVLCCVKNCPSSATGKIEQVLKMHFLSLRSPSFGPELDLKFCSAHNQITAGKDATCDVDK